jgi:hypothetical protein
MATVRQPLFELLRTLAQNNLKPASMTSGFRTKIQDAAVKTSREYHPVDEKKGAAQP